MEFDPVVYVPYTSDVVWNMNVLLRTDGDMAAAAAALRARLRPSIPICRSSTCARWTTC